MFDFLMFYWRNIKLITESEANLMIGRFLRTKTQQSLPNFLFIEEKHCFLSIFDIPYITKIQDISLEQTEYFTTFRFNIREFIKVPLSGLKNLYNRLNRCRFTVTCRLVVSRSYSPMRKSSLIGGITVYSEFGSTLVPWRNLW